MHTCNIIDSQKQRIINIAFGQSVVNDTSVKEKLSKAQISQIIRTKTKLVRGFEYHSDPHATSLAKDTPHISGTDDCNK